MAATALLVVLGVLAGGLTTLAGLGGGVLLVLALSLAHSPAEALAMSSPALLVGNLHRLAVGWAAVDRKVARAFAWGALPGSALGGALAVSLPAGLLQALLVASTGLALLQASGRLSFRPGAGALVPAGLGVGVLAAAILLGNAVGQRLRGHMPPRVATRLEFGVLLVCVALAVAGL